MAVFRALVRLIWGGEIDRELRPVVAVTLATSVAGSSLWTFMALWGLDVLHGKSALPFVFLVGSILAGFSGYAGGWMSDRIGRRKVILVGEALMIFYPLVLLVASNDRRVGLFALVFFGAVGSLGRSVSQAMVADLVAPERLPAAYASVRIAANFGVILGPPFGSLVLLAGGWNALFVAVSVLSAVAWFLALKLLPRRGAYAPAGPPDRGSFAAIARDRPFMLFLGSAIFAWIVYVAYEIVLPVSLVDGYGYDTSAWGFLVWINPFLVTFLQMRVTRVTSHLSAPRVLVVAMLVMGLPFLLFLWSHSLPIVITVLVVFVIGEMLWAPTSTTIVADLAPDDIRGAYMGAFGSGAAIGFALAPLIGLQARNSFGDNFTWTMFAGISVVAAVMAAAALSLGGHRKRLTPEALVEA
jgi:predicted MFS family arabinose efflux permease